MKTLVVRGLLCECRRTNKKFKNGKDSGEKLFVSLKNVELTKEDKKMLVDVFATVGSKFRPSWVTDFKGYVNTSTQFELPVKFIDKEYKSVEEFITENDFPWKNADVSLALNIKEGAVYPKAMKIHSQGQEVSPFDDFEEDEDLPFNK